MCRNGQELARSTQVQWGKAASKYDCVNVGAVVSIGSFSLDIEPNKSCTNIINHVFHLLSTNNVRS